MPFIPPPPPPSEEREFDEARAPDDDSLWQQHEIAPLPQVGSEALLLPRCEAQLKKAILHGTLRTLVAAIRQNGCTSIKGEPCAKCKICPAGSAWQEVAGYFNPQKQTVYICAEKEPTQGRIEQTLTHELLRAYDHCRFGTRVPFVGHQAPWALSCAATACSEVRAYLLSSFKAVTASTGVGEDRLGGDSGSSATFSDPYSGTMRSGISSNALSDSTRMQIYNAALRSPDLQRACAREGKDSRGILDAIFNPCTDDAAPFGPTPVRAPANCS